MAPKYVGKEPTPAPEWITADTIAVREIRWLWHPYIPCGTVTAIYGRGGMGKSWVTCGLASCISTGEPLPGQSGHKRKGQNVLMLSAEDDYAEVLVPRLIQMGADLTKIALPRRQFILDPKGIGWMQDAMMEYASAVVMIDPIVYYAGGKMDINKANEVRAMMEKLKNSAHAARAALIIVGHIRKSQEGTDGDLMMGSADWINAARSALFATTTPDGMHILKHAKSNYGPKGPAISYTFGHNGFEWGDIYDEDDLPTKRRDGKVAEAQDFLRTLLANGPEPAKNVEIETKQAGIAPATLNRAKVGVAESYFSRTAGCWMWRLLQKEEKE